MIFRSDCADYCVTAIRALMQEKSIPPLPGNVTVDELYAFSKYHGVEAMVWHCLEQLPLDFSDPSLQDWKNRADMLLIQSMVQLQEREILFTVLQDAGVPILPVKGCWLKERYPEIDYRQMSDLDILIRPEDAEKAKAVMLSLGYSVSVFDVGNQDDYAKPPYMGVELHRSLLPEEDPNYSYYLDVWERALPVAGYSSLRQLTPEDEYVYFLLHLYKHVTQAGAGIRPCLDSVVYRRICPGLDRAYLQQEYQKLGIAAFAEAIEQLSDCWFDTGAAIPQQLKAMAESILSAGTYGTEAQLLQNEMEPLRETFRNPMLVKIAHLLRLVFLPPERMAKLYPILEKLPFLLPMFWIRRIVSRLLFKRQAVKNVIENVNEAGDKLWSRFDWRDFRSK